MAKTKRIPPHECYHFRAITESVMECVHCGRHQPNPFGPMCVGFKLTNDPSDDSLDVKMGEDTDYGSGESHGQRNVDLW